MNQPQIKVHKLKKSIGGGNLCSWSENNQQFNLSFKKSLYTRAISQNLHAQPSRFSLQSKKNFKSYILIDKSLCAQTKEQ